MTGVYGWCHLSRPQQASSPDDVNATNGVSFHRIVEPLRAVRDGGYTDTAVGSVLDDETLERYDTIVVSMLHDERGTEAWQKVAANGSHRLVIDIDDAMWAPDWEVFKRHYTEERLHLLLANVTAAHVVTTPSPVIAEYLHRHNRNVWIVPNTVPEWVTEFGRVPLPGEQVSDTSRWTLGYQGSPSHVRDWPLSQRKAVARFAREHDWNVLFAGLGEIPDGWDASRTFATPWRPAGSVEYYTGLQFNVGIGPLKDTYFNRAKSGLRAVEYQALGIVPVLPDLPIYRPYIDDGVNGRLVQSHQTLRGVLAEIAAQPDWIEAMADNARQAGRQHTTEANVERWISAWVSR